MNATHLIYRDGSVLPEDERHRGSYPDTTPARTTGGFQLWNSHTAENVTTRFILTPSGWAFVVQDGESVTAHRGSTKEFYEGLGRKWSHGCRPEPRPVASQVDAEAAKAWLVAQANHTCGMCGALVWLRNYSSPHAEKLALQKRCSQCEFWFERATEEDSSTVRVKGTHYQMGSRTSGSFRGFGGAKFRVRFFDGRKATCADMWCQGEIPERFREMLPDNAVFLSDGAEAVIGDLELEQGHQATEEQLREFSR